MEKEVFDLNALTCVLPDAPSTEQQELFTQKLQQCCVIFDFLDSVTDLKSKEIKRATLNELVDYVSTNRGVLVESAYPEITDMVSTLAVLAKWRWSRFETQRRATLLLCICSDGATAPTASHGVLMTHGQHLEHNSHYYSTAVIHSRSSPVERSTSTFALGPPVESKN